MSKIAILGATGHIAKGLTEQFARQSEHELFLFARTVPDDVAHLGLYPNYPERIRIKPFADFRQGEYDVIINCVGSTTRSGIFRVTEEFDALSIEYLETHPGTLYLNFSSGAVYSSEFNLPADFETETKLTVNQMKPQNDYGVAKLYFEAKHRAMEHMRIVDLRVFGYFSKFIDLNRRYLMSNIVQSLRSGTPLITNRENIIRDYCDPADLYALIDACIRLTGPLNTAFDVYSRQPVSKFDLLHRFSQQFGLKFTVIDHGAEESSTGMKLQYYSTYHHAASIGYEPRYTSLESVAAQTELILSTF